MIQQNTQLYMRYKCEVWAHNLSCVINSKPMQGPAIHMNDAKQGRLSHNKILIMHACSMHARNVKIEIL
jgi:hypothetical protein